MFTQKIAAYSLGKIKHYVALNIVLLMLKQVVYKIITAI